MIRQEKTTLRPKIEHIHDLEWQKAEIQVPENLQIIRMQSTPTKIIAEEPGAATWLNQDYAGQDIGRELRNLANRKALGGRWRTRRSIQSNQKMGNQTDKRESRTK